MLSVYRITHGWWVAEVWDSPGWRLKGTVRLVGYGDNFFFTIPFVGIERFPFAVVRGDLMESVVPCGVNIGKYNFYRDSQSFDDSAESIGQD